MPIQDLSRTLALPLVPTWNGLVTIVIVGKESHLHLYCVSGSPKEHCLPEVFASLPNPAELSLMTRGRSKHSGVVESKMLIPPFLILARWTSEEKTL